MLYFSILSTGLLAVYSVLVLFLARGLKKLPLPDRSGNGDGWPEGGLSLIIPFRNEEKALPLLLEDLLKQDAEDLAFRVLLVNDHSTDASVSEVEAFLGEEPRFLLLHLPEKESGKKNALALGISEADTEWILQVDADCRVGPAFISSQLSYAESFGSDLLAGPLSIAPGRGSFLEAFERFDVLSLTGAGAGSFYYGHPLMCSGANLMYKRELYEATRSFDPSATASGDDMFLLIGARRLKRRIAFNPDPASLVTTVAQTSWRDLVRQRMRWGAKSSRYRMPDIQLTALLVALANLAFVLIPLIAGLQVGTIVFLLPAAGLKMLADFLLIRRMADRYTHGPALKYYLPVALLHPFYTVMIVLALPFRGREWD